MNKIKGNWQYIQNIFFYYWAISWFISVANAGCIGLNCQCTITASPINFGSYNPLSQHALDAVGRISIRCGGFLLGLNVSYSISLSTGYSKTFLSRTMQNGAHRLRYNIYTGAGRSVIWGDGLSGTKVVIDRYLVNLLSAGREYIMYGKLPGSQNVPPGFYTDTIVATVTF